MMNEGHRHCRMDNCSLSSLGSFGLSRILLTFVFLYEIQTKEVCGDCLILTPFIRNGSIELVRQLSEVDSEKFLGVRSHSGFITVKDEYDSNLFFWFFPAPVLKDTPWIIWLQGGPGITSMLGLFDLIGPFKIEDGKLILRNVSWAEDYSILFLDNPVGAGFSFTRDDRGYTRNEDDVGSQMLMFLQQFLQVFPELRSAPLFVAGESYAGKYVPALGIKIHMHKNETHPINLRGFMIGNGLIDMRSMMHYSDLCSVLGLLDDKENEQLKKLEQSVVKLIDENKLIDASNAFNATIEYIRKHSGVNIYNFNEDPNRVPTEFEHFITQPEVRKWIHAGNATFDLENQLVYQKMLSDIANTTKPWVEELLEHYGIMAYSGQLDVILPHGLSKHIYASLQWSRRDEYVKATRKRLRRSANGSIVAYKKSGGNFVEVLVRRSGHMVPLDQPEVAKFIVDIFIKDFKDNK